MNVLVIGGTGPTGPYVVNGLIERGHKVTILHRGVHEVDFIEPIEHLHSDPHFKETLEETLRNRTFDLVVGMYGRTRYVAEVVKGRTPRFIMIGTVLYEPGLIQPIPETAPVRKAPGMAEMIRLTEQVVMEAHQQGHYSVTLMRYPWIYGPRQMAPRDWPIIRRILDGRKHLILPDSGLYLDSVGYAENAAQATLLAVDKPKESDGQIYNVRDEVALTIRQRVEMITKVMNYEWEIVNLPCELAWATFPYTAPTRGDVPLLFLQHRLIDISKIKTQLGYRDVVPIGEAIERTVKWFLEHRPQPGGPEEISLGDPFDYAAEDRLIQETKEFYKKAKALPHTQLHFVHPYPHPKKPESKP